MKILDVLERNKDNTIVVNRNNVMLLMQYIIDNNISNIRHFISNELKLNYGSYNNLLKKIEEENPEFYAYYNNSVEESKKNTLDNINNALVQVGVLMNTGVELEDGSYRKFDLYDWLVIKNKYFDNYNRKEISKILNDFSNSIVIYEKDIKFFELRAFISDAFGDNLTSYSEPIYKCYILNDKFSNLTDEEILKLIDFMEKNNIPFNYRNYCFGVEKMKKQRNNPNDIFAIDIEPIENKKYVKRR